MKKQFWLFFFSSSIALAQAPVLSYTSPIDLAIGQSMTPLAPTNSGSPIVAGLQVSTFAGSGSVGSADGWSTTASFNLPTVVALDSYQNIFVVDRINNKIRKITPSGLVTTFAGSGGFGATDGPADTATFTYPDGAIFDSQNNLYVSDQSIHKIRKITSDGTVSTLAGTGAFGDVDGAGNVAQFYYPAGMAVDANDNLYVADYGNNKIRKITADGTVSTFAGTGVAGSDDGTVTTAQFNGCTGVCVDATGNVYVADYYNNKIRKIDTQGNVTTVAGTGAIGADDGPASTASFHYPAIVALAPDGTLFITDEENNKIRHIDTNGIVSTYAGTGAIGDVDGIPGVAEFYNATGVAISASNEVYVCDYGNNKIKKINVNGYSITPSLPDGLTFDTTTGIISGTPTATMPSSDYTITATNPFGQGTFVITISVSNLGTASFSKGTCSLYPNPVESELHLSAKENMDEVRIINTLGQLVKTKKHLSTNETIDVSDLSKGVYGILISGDKIQTAMSFIKE